MGDFPKYTCSCCSKVHEEWPALTYTSPTAYNNLSEEEKELIGELTGDFCVVNHPEQTDRFIRCTLTQKVIDHCEDLDYGLWVSLSEKNFRDYLDNYDNKNYQAKYFGWLSNDLADYSFSESIPTTIFTQTEGLRPEIIPHKDFDHPFIHDYYNGITKKEAERRIDAMLQAIAERDSK